jgi:hypothetical protein
MSPKHSFVEIKVGEPTISTQKHVVHPFEALDQLEEALRTIETHKTKVGQNTKEADPETNIPSIKTKKF